MNSEVPSLGADWDEVVALTSEMEAGAQSGEWERVVELEHRRREAMERFFAAGVSPEMADETAKAIEALMARDRAIVDGCGDKKRAVVQNILSLNKSQRAVNAYAST